MGAARPARAPGRPYPVGALPARVPPCSLSVLLAALQRPRSGLLLGSPREGRGAGKAAVGSAPGEPALPVRPPRGRFLGLAQQNREDERCVVRAWPPAHVAPIAGGGPCKQQCRDTGEEVVCSCFVGYQLLPDGVSCEGKGRRAPGTAGRQAAALGSPAGSRRPGGAPSWVNESPGSGLWHALEFAPCAVMRQGRVRGLTGRCVQDLPCGPGHVPEPLRESGRWRKVTAPCRGRRGHGTPVCLARA